VAAGAAGARASKTQRRSAADGADARRLAAGRGANRKLSLAALPRHPRSIRVHLRHLLLICVESYLPWRVTHDRGGARHSPPRAQSDDDRLCATSLVAANGCAACIFCHLRLNSYFAMLPANDYGRVDASAMEPMRNWDRCAWHFAVPPMQTALLHATRGLGNFLCSMVMTDRPDRTALHCNEKSRFRPGLCPLAPQEVKL
jgi:hypothetical protein